MTGALEGLKVVDLTTVVAAPMATRLLADHGATVVKIETELRPDTLRTNTPFRDNLPGLNRSGYFLTYNSGKYSLALNLQRPAARDFFRRHLLPWADVIVEAFAPGVLEGMELDYERLRPLRPDLIMARVCLMGHTGQYAPLKGFGQFPAAMAGFYEVTGWPDRDPVGPFSAYSDFVGWNFLLIGLLAALDHRRRTGQGQYIDQSLLESTAHFATHALLDYQANGRLASRMGNRDPDAAPHGVYRCQDEEDGMEAWCAIAVTSDEQWQGLCQVMERPGLGQDPRFAILPARKEHEEELDGIVGAWTATRRAEEVMRVLQAAGVPAGGVQNVRHLFQDPQLAHRGHFVQLDHPEVGPHYVPTASFRLSETPGIPQRGAPLLGEHTEMVCRGLLGLDEEELANWVAQEIFE